MPTAKSTTTSTRKPKDSPNAEVKTTASTGTRAKTTEAKAKSATRKTVKRKPTAKRKKPVKAVKAVKPDVTSDTVEAIVFGDGSKFHQLRKAIVPFQSRPVMRDAESLLKGVKSYFDWCDDNPIQHGVGIDKDGIPIVLSKPRPYLVEGLANHIGISKRHWYDICDNRSRAYREDLSDVTEWANNAMFVQKVSGALVDVFKENTVARLHGLTDKTEVSGPDGGAITIAAAGAEVRTKLLAEVREDLQELVNKSETVEVKPVKALPAKRKQVTRKRTTTKAKTTTATKAKPKTTTTRRRTTRKTAK